MRPPTILRFPRLVGWSAVPIVVLTVPIVVLTVAIVVLTVAVAVAQPAAVASRTGPWDLETLTKAPAYEWGVRQSGVRQVFYENESYRGTGTRVFAWYAQPAEGDGPFPAMLLVHGGGGKAFSEWTRLWAARGYCALAMDLAGQGPDGKRMKDGGPNQTDVEKFAEFDETTVRQMWTYHAIAAVLRGHSLLATLPEVDADRIGVTGISWGGYLTCIVAGLDARLKVAVPVYGCGYLHENSVWLPRFAAMAPDQRERWIDNFDPSRYLPEVRCPILFVNGTNDFAYPLDSYQKSYRAVPGDKQLCITVRMPHGHQAGWAPREIGHFVDGVLAGGEPLPRIARPEIRNSWLTAIVESESRVGTSQLHFASDTGPWETRVWQSVEAVLQAGTITADLPQDRPLVCFVTVQDEQGNTVSSEHLQLVP